MSFTTKNVRGRRTPLREHEIYVGRANPRYRLSESPLANPFATKNEADRLAAIARYGEWLAEQISARNPAVTVELARIRALATRYPDVQLFCWCAPHPCHADVIAAVLAVDSGVSSDLTRNP